MTATKPPSSDIDAHPVVVLEGMPGTGKTTIAHTLAAENRVVIGEYTTPAGDVVPVGDHPAVDDDSAHQDNWLRKHNQVHAARHRGPVFVDRDWLSALAYAYSVADTDRGTLLANRAAWVLDCLDRGALAIGDVYVVFQLDPAVSVRRRAHRLTPGHPWSRLPGLIRLAAFYLDPPTVLMRVQPDLADRLRTASWHPMRGQSLERATRFVREMANLS